MMGDRSWLCRLMPALLLPLIVTAAAGAIDVQSDTSLKTQIDKSVGDGAAEVRRMGEEARQRAANSPSGMPSDIHCASSDTCFQVVKSKGNSVTVMCIKGDGYKIGKQFDICEGSNGKWASGCGVTDSFAHHYDFRKAGNLACD